MRILFAKPSILIPVAILLGVIALWEFPFARLTLMLILLLFSAVEGLASVLAKHRKAYLRGASTPGMFVRNVVVETALLLLAMTLAGFLGHYLAHVVTGEISHDFIRFVAGLATGLLVGMGVGVAMHLSLGKFVKTSAKH